MDEFYPIYKINSFEEGPLLKKNDIHDIIVKNIDRIDPHDKFQFDFQISSNQFLSTTLKGTLKSFYENRKTKMISLIKFDSYTPCVYFDADKNEWCRGEILKLISGNVYAVKLVDYGEIKCLNSFYLKACDKKFLKPFKQDKYPKHLMQSKLKAYKPIIIQVILDFNFFCLILSVFI